MRSRRSDEFDCVIIGAYDDFERRRENTWKVRCVRCWQEMKKREKEYLAVLELSILAHKYESKR